VIPLKLTASCPPHVLSGRTVRGLMIETLLALCPAAAMAVWHYGLPALRVMALCAGAAVCAEWAVERLSGRPVRVDDGSALLLGLLTAFLLPATAPWWLALAAAFIAVLLGRELFGGLGGNPLCPPLLGWAICMLSWRGLMKPEFAVLHTELVSPLSELKYQGLAVADRFPALDLLLGQQLSGLGAAQAGALLLGGLWLVLRGRLRPHIPFGFLAGTALMALVLQLLRPGVSAGPLFHLLAGGTVFAAFFLATDPASSPVTRRGMAAYGLFAGAMSVVIRTFGVWIDGAFFAVLLAGLATPMFDRLRPRVFPAPGRG